MHGNVCFVPWRFSLDVNGGKETSHGLLRFVTGHPRFALSSEIMRKTKRLRRRLWKCLNSFIRGSRCLGQKIGLISISTLSELQRILLSVVFSMKRSRRLHSCSFLVYVQWLATCKRVQNSLGFWNLHCGLIRIPCQWILDYDSNR